MSVSGRDGRVRKRPNRAADLAARSILKEHGPVFEDVPVLTVRGCAGHNHKNRAEELACLASRSAK